MQHTTAVNCVSNIKFGYSIYQYHCIHNLQHLLQGKFLYPAEIWLKFVKLQEGTWRLVLSIMEGQNLDLGKT